MSYTISQILDKEAPQFISDPDKDYFIEQAKLYYNIDCYGDKYNLVVALQAAHDMSIRDLQNGAGSGSNGNVTQKSEGDQSISFGNITSDPSSNAYLQLTRYGQKILHIKRCTLIGLSASGSDDICLPLCL